jgi:hypothetical protein
MWLPLIVLVVIAVVFLAITVQIAGGLALWVRNNRMPVESVPARVVAKRTDTWGSGGLHTRGRVRTLYFATFELKTGDRLEFELHGRDYGLLVEGDEGMLTYQGTRYQGFQRRPLE